METVIEAIGAVHGDLPEDVRAATVETVHAGLEARRRGSDRELQGEAVQQRIKLSMTEAIPRMADRTGGLVLLNLSIGNIEQFQLLFRQLMQGVIPGETVRMPVIHQFSVGLLGLSRGGVRGQPQGFIAFEDVHRR